MQYETSLIDRKAFLYYRSKASKIRKKKVNRILFPKIVSAIFQEIANGIVEQKSGVYIKKFGYFAVWMTPTKRKTKIYTNKATETVTYNLHTNSYIYHPAFFTDIFRGKSKLNYFSMDKSFTRPLKTELCRRLKAGQKYTLKYTMLKKLNTGKDECK